MCREFLLSSLGFFFLQKFEKCWNVNFWANVLLRQSRVWASRASPAQKSQVLRVVYSKNFSRTTFLFSRSLIWRIAIWTICLWNKFEEKAQCEGSQQNCQRRTRLAIWHDFVCCRLWIVLDLAQTLSRSESEKANTIKGTIHPSLSLLPSANLFLPLNKGHQFLLKRVRIYFGKLSTMIETW